MSEEEKSSGETGSGTATASEQPLEQPVVDEHTTAPNPQSAPTAPPKWEMPSPVFQQTSGYLPQGFVKDIETAAGGQDETSPDALPSRPAAKEPDLSAINLSAPAPPAAVAPAAAIEPQPDLSEILVPDDPEFETVPEPPKNRDGVRASMVVIGVAAILAFVVVFLTVIYFLFLKGSGDTNNF